MSRGNKKKGEFFMDFSERLKKLRKEAGLTQKELSENLNVAQPRILEWEKGKRNPNKRSLEKIASYFNVSVSYLLGETNVRSSFEIIEIMENLSEFRQEKTVNFARQELKDQEEENNIIQFKSSLIPYEVEEEQALSAGYGEGYTNTYTKETVYWNKDIAYDRAIRIKGESMEPEYHYGEIALIKYQECIDYPGQVCAVDDVERGKAYIKCVSKTENGLLLESINDLEDKEGNRLFPNIFIPFEENPRIIGVVKEHFLPIEI